MPLPQPVVNYLGQSSDFDSWDESTSIPVETLLERAGQADGIIARSIAVNDSLLSSLPRLRAVSTASVGYDHFDVEALAHHRVIATHTPTVLDETVADLTFALILGAARRIAELDRAVRSGRWGKEAPENFFGVDVHHRTLGIIGMGRIGEAVARRAKFGFGMDVVYHNRSQRPHIEDQYGATFMSLDDLLQISDFVVLLTPLTPDTRGLMDKRAFDMMKPSSTFINVSRGQTVDEAALCEALRNGSIRAAGLDVFVEEPTPVTNPLLQLDNVVVVPHIGSATQQTRDDMAMLAATNLVAALEGRLDDAKVIPELQSLVREWV